MIFNVVVHRNSIMFPTIGNYLVDTSSGEIAATFALSVAKRDFPEEEGLHVVRCSVVDGDFIGSPPNTASSRLVSTSRKSARKSGGKSKVSQPA